MPRPAGQGEGRSAQSPGPKVATFLGGTGSGPVSLARMNVHLVDGTYELFRHHFALPSHRDPQGMEVAAVRGVLRSLMGLLEEGATHVGIATDHVIESFRNGLWPGYKTGEGAPKELLAQFPLLEEGLRAMGLVCWAMVEYEADDALGSAAAKAAADPDVERVFIMTPDKDLAQCVVGERVVQFDRRKGSITDAAGVVAKFGVPPESIPDFLGLVGDSADGFPGVPGWGAKGTAAVLSVYGHLEAIPEHPWNWDSSIASAKRLATALAENRERAFLFRELARLRLDVPVFEDVEDLRWEGPGEGFEVLCARLGAEDLLRRSGRLVKRREA